MRTPDRFADAPPLGRELLRAEHADGAALSPAQQRFNQLLAQLGKARAELRDWQQASEGFGHALQDRLLPAERAYAEAQREYLRALDDLLQDPPPGLRLTGRRRAQAESVVLSLCAELLGHAGAADSEIVAIHDRYSGCTHDELEALRDEEERALMQVIASQFGIEDGVGEADGVDSETLRARLDAEFATRAARAQAEWTADPAAQRAERARQRARERAEAKRAVDLQASVREIYRKLVRDLHPDRETDPAERARKTGLMQQINQAYEAGDLLTLLELQFQLEQLDPARLAQLSAERLKPYTAVLREQLKALREQIEQRVEDLRERYGLPPGLALRRPVDLLRWLEQQVSLRRQLAQDYTASAARLRNPHQRRLELDLLLRSGGR